MESNTIEVAAKKWRTSDAGLRIVVIGLGQMGRSHALAYHKNPGYELVALVNRSVVQLPAELQEYTVLSTIDEALGLNPDVVSICTHVDTHAEYAIKAMENGAHVFVEKPLAATVETAKQVVQVAQRTGKKLLVGYILRHHPSWNEFITRARRLGPPFVMRMNLNQRSTGPAWAIHKQLMATTSPVVDCGVHYLDVMLQITDSKPIQVRGMGVRLSDEIPLDQVNYGHLQVLFADGSVGWYEAGWGPMISETAYFVKDVMGPKGAVSIVGQEGASSADVDGHTKTARIRLQDAVNGQDVLLSTNEEPDHNELCEREQHFLLQAITENVNLTEHWGNAVQSLAIVLAADRSMREGRAIDL